MKNILTFWAAVLLNGLLIIMLFYSDSCSIYGRLAERAAENHVAMSEIGNVEGALREQEKLVEYNELFKYVTLNHQWAGTYLLCICIAGVGIEKFLLYSKLNPRHLVKCCGCNSLVIPISRRMLKAKFFVYCMWILSTILTFMITIVSDLAIGESLLMVVGSFVLVLVGMLIIRIQFSGFKICPNCACNCSYE
jgi:hypothetical protein